VKVVLTHAEGRLEGLAEALQARGLEVRHRPLIAVRPRADDATRARAHEVLALPWLLFPSRSAVDAWVGLGIGFGGEGGVPSGVTTPSVFAAPSGVAARSGVPTPHLAAAPRVGAVGPGTAHALRAAGAVVALEARPANAAGLAHAFARHSAAAGPVGLPQGSHARPELAGALARAGFATHSVVLYDTVPLPWSDDADDDTDDYADDDAGIVVLASPSAVASLFDERAEGGDAVGRREVAPTADEGAPPTDDGAPLAAVRGARADDRAPRTDDGAPQRRGRFAARLVAIGPTTADAVRARGRPCWVAAHPDVDGVLAAVLRAATEGPAVARRVAARMEKEGIVHG